jgi:hypothetical protein
MSAPIDSLILDFLEWLAVAPQPYGEVMAAWRTSCPRLTVWEDAIEAGYVTRLDSGASGPLVCITERGAALLVANGRKVKTPA